MKNKFLEKIKAFNNKCQNKDAFLTHQIKINKKIIIEAQTRKITKMLRKQDTIKSRETEEDHETEIKKNKYENIFHSVLQGVYVLQIFKL